jgi:phenylacetate-CoA ligase
MPLWNAQFESMPRSDLRKIQLQRLQALVERAAHLSPLYRQRFAETGVRPEQIRSLEDIARLPFTTKDDLRFHYPWGMCTVPMKDVVRVHTSSGTTGKPIVACYTRADMQVWQEVCARSLTSAGVTAEDIIHNGYGYGLFTGGLGIQLGAEAIGATVVPVSAGLTERQLMLLEDFGATVITCTPSYALVLGEAAAAAGIDVRERFKLRVGIFGAEPWTEEMRHDLQEGLGLIAYDIYGLTEIIGPGVSMECDHHDGLHIFEDQFYPEIIEPASGEPLGFGAVGELVFTTLTKEAMPLIRYRTGDRTILYQEPCACGRTMVRMAKVLGRTDDMLIVRGVNVFPSQIEKLLLEFDELAPQYQIIVDRPRHQLDTLEVQVEATDAFFQSADSTRVIDLEKRIQKHLHGALVVHGKITVLKPHSLERSIGKAKRVVDRRNLTA